VFGKAVEINICGERARARARLDLGIIDSGSSPVRPDVRVPDYQEKRVGVANKDTTKQQKFLGWGIKKSSLVRALYRTLPASSCTFQLLIMSYDTRQIPDFLQMLARGPADCEPPNNTQEMQRWVSTRM